MTNILEPGEVDDLDSYGSRSIDLFEKQQLVGEGTYGQVYIAANKETGEVVALKKVRMDNEKEGFPITAIREIKILKELNHKNIMGLKEIVTNATGDEAYMVCEYMDHDLTGLMYEHLRWFSVAQIKCYMKQLLEALHYIHKNKVLHRDIKGANLLIDNEGILKLADFGLARPFSSNVQKYTNRVITLWYRPPELLLGSHQYGPHVDMWSAGCILGELLAKRPIFPGKNEIDQVELIFNLCGTPNEENWQGVQDLPYYDMFKPKMVYKSQIREKFKEFSPDALDLIERLLCLNPEKRITAEQALDTDYFWTEPLPANPTDLPKYASVHEYQTKKRQQQESQSNANKRARTEHGSRNVNTNDPFNPNTQRSSSVPNNGPKRTDNYPRNNQNFNPHNNPQNNTHNNSHNNSHMRNNMQNNHHNPRGNFPPQNIKPGYNPHHGNPSQNNYPPNNYQNQPHNNYPPNNQHPGNRGNYHGPNNFNHNRGGYGNNQYQGPPNNNNRGGYHNNNRGNYNNNNRN